MSTYVLLLGIRYRDTNKYLLTHALLTLPCVTKRNLDI